MSCKHQLNDYGLMAEMARTSSRQVILGTSVSTTTIRPNLTREHLLRGRDIDHPLCKYRKGFLDHLKPRAFLMSTLRVVIQQASLIVANFMSDQLEGELKRNQAVQDGSISQGEADEQAQEWEKAEWEKRWKVFPNRFLTAFAKYHVITLLMRTYEHLASLRYDEVVLDKLTMDPFFAARRIVASKAAEKSSDSSSNTTVIAKEMFHTTFWANLIAFMADYSVHQVILCYGYYAYIRRKRKQQASTQSFPKEESVVVVDAVIMTSLLRKSTQLLVSRSFGLFCSALGGAIGTLWWPGWGTVLLSNMGEGAASVVMDDGQSSGTSTGTSTTN